MAVSSVARRSLSLFVYLLILDGAAIFFFTRGFLLTRTELSMFSNCSDIIQCPSCFKSAPPSCNPEEYMSNFSTTDLTNRHTCDPSLSTEESLVPGNRRIVQEQGIAESVNQCWTRPAIKKAIILIIDALRFDFVAHSRNFDGEPKAWMDKLRILQQQIDEKHFAARMFKFIADPPTTTLQRLKGLTTGGLPTFIDIGHSFGAPAIVEDNLILQLASSGKRVVMMGDDTWMQLFPTQFTESYPFPSFNVKDLHTVDDGVIKELFPAMSRDNWDVLIGHFLGVDHVGHIFGVESPLMPEKLEQYNKVIEDVVELLRNSSQPGGLFEDTLLIVMGDHGQTLNGDHGGGTPEEVETGLFALGTHHLSSSILEDIFHSSCDLEDPVSGCINTFSQLDFSATLAALLGIPFPFGSVGKVNMDLFSLVARNSLSETEISEGKQEALWLSLKLMEQYREVLCMNSWQVRRYFQVYAKLAITGFPPVDMALLDDLYTKAQNSSGEYEESGCDLSSSEDVQAEEMISMAMKAVFQQVEAYQEYLSAAASLARSQWTQFGLEWMVFGFLLLIACVAVRVQALYLLCHSSPKTFHKLFPSKALLIGSLVSAYLTAMVAVLLPILARTSYHSVYDYFSANLGTIFVGIMVVASGAAYFTSSQGICFVRTMDSPVDGKRLQEDTEWGGFDHLDVRTVGASLFVAVHALSLFSNSYIVAEGRVINFLLASSGVLYLRDAIQAKSKVLQAFCFVALIWIIPKIHVLTIFKSVMAGEGHVASDWVPSSLQDNLLLLQMLSTCLTILLPLAILSFLLYQKANQGPAWWLVSLGVTVMYILIGLHWLTMDLTSNGLFGIPDSLIQIGRLHLPRLIYAMTLLLTLTAASLGMFCKEGLDSKVVSYVEVLVMVGTALLAGGSGSVILLMGRKGPLLTLLALLEVCLFLELQSVTPQWHRMKIRDSYSLEHVDTIEIKTPVRAIIDWSLIAMQLFFCTGHSCAFDGLHYSAAFIGFDDFGFFQQGVLLGIETFGASHVFPIMGLPLILAVFVSPTSAAQISEDKSIILEITKGYLWFGLVRAIIVSVTTVSVCIQRRHLMVWGIFAPKYVFDAVGFLIVDIFVILASALYFFLRPRKLHKA